MNDSGIRFREATWSADERAIADVRRRVFIEEQDVPEDLEWDGIDDECRHVLAFDGERAVATGRLVPGGKIGRMAVLPDYRHRGIGRDVLRRLMAMAREEGLSGCELSAQTSAMDFYAREGFRPTGGEFMDAGIPHRRMVMTFESEEG